MSKIKPNGKDEKLNFFESRVFSLRLKNLLDDRKVKQATLADICGVTRQAVGQWVRNETIPDIFYLKKIAEFFNVSADYLIGLTEVPHRSYEDLINDHEELTYKVNNFKEWFEKMAECVKNNL